MKKATIADVAELAGVSKPTVSRYLKQEKVREDIAEKIRAAIVQTGYVARGVKTEKVNTEKQSTTKSSEENFHFGILVKDITAPKTIYTIQALQEVLHKQGHSFSICVTNNDPELEKNYISGYSKRVDGIFVESCSDMNFINDLVKDQIPVLFISEHSDKVNCCGFDEEEAGKVLADYMLSKELLLVHYLGTDEKTANQRMEGIRSVYHEKNQPVGLEVTLCDGSYEDIYEKIKEAFNQRFDVLLLENDEMAIPLMKFSKEYHVAFPQNASIISFGGHPLCKVISPFLCALVYDYEAYANNVYQHMNALISHASVNEYKHTYYVQEGESVR